MADSVLSIVGVDVSTRLKELNPTVSTTVVEIIAQEKHKERVEAFKKVYISLVDLDKTLARIKPDNIVYDIENNPIQEGYSKAKLDEIKKLKENIQKHEKALHLASADCGYDFSKVMELAKSS